MDFAQSGALFQGAVVCCGFAGFILSAVWTLCRVFWKSSVVPAATTITEPKETCEIITRSLHQLRTNAAGLVESKFPPQSLASLDDNESTVAGSNQGASGPESSPGSSRSSTLNSQDQGVQNHSQQAADGRQQRPGLKNERTVSFSPLPITSFSETHSWPTSPGKRSKAPKRVVSSPTPSPPPSPPTSVFTAPPESLPLPSNSSTSTAFPAPPPPSSIDYSMEGKTDPSSSIRSRSPTRKLRKFMSLHWPTQQQQTASLNSTAVGDSSQSPNKVGVKSPCKQQLKTLRKSRSDTRDCLRASSTTFGDSPKALGNLPLPSPQIIVSSDTTSALLSPPLPPTPQSTKPQKKRQNTARTDPYAAPYFCPVPGSVEAIGTQTLAPRVTPARRATSPAPPLPVNSTPEFGQGAELRRRGASATFPVSGR